MAITVYANTNQPGSDAYNEAVANPGTYTLRRLQELSDPANSYQLNGHPEWANAVTLYQNFSRLYGRAPTQSEVNKFVPYYLQDPTLGNAYLEQAYKDYQNSPEQLQQKATGKYGDVSSMFQSLLGRDATDAEKSHFGSLLASGQLDPYGLSNFIQNTSEYTNTKDKKFQDEQRSQLESADTTYYNEKLLPSLQAQFAKQGRSLESSGFASALAQAAKQQAQEREKYLTNLSASQYQGREGAARSDYETYMNNLYANQNYDKNRSNQINDYYTNRSNNLQDYQLQKQAYDEYLSRYGKKKGNGIASSLTGAIGGAGVGAQAGGGWGAVLGGLLGGGLGFASNG